MNSRNLDCFVDSDGIQTEFKIDNFGDDNVTLIDLDAEKVDEYFYDSIDNFFSNKESVKKSVDRAVNEYLLEKLTCKGEGESCQLMLVYFFPDEDMGIFGLMLRHDFYVEHGIGIYFNSMEVQKVGFGDVAFMG